MGFFGGGSRGRTDAGANRSTATKIGVGTINEKGKVVGSFFQTAGADKSNRDIDKMPLSGTKIIANILKKPLAKNAKRNRSFFENMVVGNKKKNSKYSSLSSAEFSKMSEEEKEKVYSGYVSDRNSGRKDAYGRDPTGGGEGGSNMGGAETNPQGIELAKAATGSATILGPAQIQKTAANTTAIKMSAAQTNVANKRKGRKSTNITAKKTLDNNYTLSKKTLLG